MYCKNCGRQNLETSNFCENCGENLTHIARSNESASMVSQETDNNATINNIEEGNTIGWAILGFFVPAVGVLLFLIWKKDRPKASASSLKGALIAICLGFSTYSIVDIIDNILNGDIIPILVFIIPITLLITLRARNKFKFSGNKTIDILGIMAVWFIAWIIISPILTVILSSI